MKKFDLVMHGWMLGLQVTRLTGFNLAPFSSGGASDSVHMKYVN